MGFEVSQGSPMSIWVPIDYTTTVYVGGIVGWDETNLADMEGAVMLPQAGGASNVTNYDQPFGVVIGTNNRKPLYNSTGKCEYITSATPHDSTSEFVLTGGPYIGGGHEAMVKINVIDPTTVLKGPIWNAGVGAAISEVACGANAAGTGTTSTSAVQVAPIDGASTIYFRTGANRGTYRLLSTTSTTVHAWALPVHKDIVAGDIAVVANLRPFGMSQVQLIATYSSGFDVAEACTSDYFQIDVLRLDLREQYKEWVEFRWNVSNFITIAGARD